MTVSTDSDSISAHYDRRGLGQLASHDTEIGSLSVTPPFRRPYAYAETIVADAFARGLRTFADVCCGIGYHGLSAARAGFAVRGVDLSPKSVEAARQLAEARKLSARFQVEVGDAIAWLERSTPSDVVFMSGSLYYLRALLSGDAIPKRLTQRGMFLCIETNGSNLVASVLRRIRSATRGDRDQATLEGLLRLSEFDELRRRFSSSRVIYFDLFTPIVVKLASRLPPRVAATLGTAAGWLDDRLLNLPGLRYFAFKVVFIGQR